VSRRGWIYFALLCVVWGIPYLLIKVAVQEVSAPMIVFARTAVGAAILLPLAARGRGLRTVRAHLVGLVAFAAVEIIGPWWLLSDAERRLPSSLAGLLVAAVPIIAAVLAMATGARRQVGLLPWIGLLVGLVGVVLLSAPGLGAGDAVSVIEVLLVATGYATGPIIVERRLREVPSLTVTSVCLGIAAIVYAPLAILSRPAHPPSVQAVGALAGLAVVCTAGGFVLLFELVRQVGAARAVVFTYVNPAVAVLAGVVVLGEQFRPSMAIAFVLTLGGSVLATRRAGPRAAVAAAPQEAPDSQPVPGREG
jgi:drug/metabolite transporter (DMT)-like permease